MSIELEKLEREKVELEGELQLLTEKEKTLNENVKTLEVEVAIQKSEEKIRAKRKAVERLNSRARLAKTLRGALHRNLWIYLG